MHFEKFGERCQIYTQMTDQSLEQVTKDLGAKFAPAVMLVNHEKKFPVDSTCSNLAIKYNMIYISAYQLIRDHIQRKTEYGKKLLETKRHRELNADMKVNDEFQEDLYCPVHYDDVLVKELINKTIAEKRTN